MRRSEASVHLMTYNIHRWAGRDQQIDIGRLAAVIQVADADIVGLNEVLHPVTAGQSSSAPLAELAERLGMHYAFGPSGWIDYGPSWHGPVGNALLSRYPLTDVSNTWLPRLPSTKQRSLLGATFTSGTLQGLTAFVTHLDHAFEGTRLHQMNGIIRYIARRSPHFLMGDFNTPGFLGPNTHRLLPPVLRLMRRAGYEDAFHAVGHGHGKTFPSHTPLVRIDFLFMPCHWARGFRSARALNSGVTQQASDHRPLLVEWGWSEPIAVSGVA
jgi:endonuclease/exonuclease/phosphatase family metal-dependent hydrolase